jgi:hypothetical protein
MGDIGQEFLTAQLKDELVFEGGGGGVPWA